MELGAITAVLQVKKQRRNGAVQEVVLCSGGGTEKEGSLFLV